MASSPRERKGRTRLNLQSVARSLPTHTEKERKNNPLISPAKLCFFKVLVTKHGVWRLSQATTRRPRWRIWPWTPSLDRASRSRSTQRATPPRRPAECCSRSRTTKTSNNTRLAQAVPSFSYEKNKRSRHQQRPLRERERERNHIERSLMWCRPWLLMAFVDIYSRRKLSKSLGGRSVRLSWKSQWSFSRF